MIEKYITACRFCDQECPVEIEVSDGKILNTRHIEAKKGRLCSNGAHPLEVLHNPKRLRSPLIATYDETGKKQFHTASWEEALKLTAEKLSATKARYGAESLLAVCGYNKPLHRAGYQRFCNAFGIINRAGSGNMCHMVQGVASVHTCGVRLKPDLCADTKTVVLWGLNPANTMRWDSRQLLDTVKNGAKFLFVDPIPGVYAKHADLWLPLKPGTDGVLALALLHIIFQEGWQDQELLSDHATGLSELQAMAAQMPPAKAAEICGLSVHDIEQAAQLITQNGPAAFMFGNALHHNQDSYSKCRAMMLLPVVTGNIDRPGSMVAAPTPSPRNRFMNAQLHGNELFPQDAAKQHIGHGSYGLKEFRMVASQDATNAIEENVVHAAFVHGGNPVLQWADSAATAALFERLDFLAVSDFFLTPTAMLADVVFPAATYLEYENVWIDKDDTLHYGPCLCRDYDVLPDLEIFRRLAVELGLGDRFWSSMEGFWDLICEPYGCTFAKLREQGTFAAESLPVQKKWHHFRHKGFPTADGKLNLSLPPLGFLDPISDEYPVLCTTYKPGAFFGGAGQQNPSQVKRQPVADAMVSDATAQKYGLAHGDLVRISTPVGSCEQTLRVLPHMAENTIALANACWIPEAGNLREQLAPCANNLTSRRHRIGTDMPSFSCRGIACRIEKV